MDHGQNAVKSNGVEQGHWSLVTSLQHGHSQDVVVIT